MDQNVHFRRLQQWAGLVLEAEGSGNKTAWCKENGIRYRQYLYWQKLVREFILEHGDHSLDMDGSSLPAVSRDVHQLVDVTAHVQPIPEKQMSPSAEASGIRPELMIQYRDFHIYVGSSVSESTLETVLKAARNA